MKIVRKSWKLISLAVVVGLLGAIIPLSAVSAVGSISSITDAISPNDTLSADASHTIGFTTATAIPVGGKIEITFAKAGTFDLTSVVNGDVAETLQGGDNATWAVSGQKLTGTIAATQVTAGVQSIVLNGTNKINNPATAGTYAIYISTKNAAGVVLDTGYCLVNIAGGTGASVTVKTYISVTISDTNSDGVSFGDVDPNTNNNPDVAQSTSSSTTPSVTITAGSENNATIKVQGKLNDDWVTGTWTADKTSYGLDAYDDAETSYTTSYADIKTGIVAGGTAKLWHFLDVPAGQAAGNLTNTLYYQALVS